VCYQDLDDPRIGNAGRHELPEILMISLCTTLCGGQTAVDMAEFGVAKESFLRRFLTLEHGIPRETWGFRHFWFCSFGAVLSLGANWVPNSISFCSFYL